MNSTLKGKVPGVVNNYSERERGGFTDYRLPTCSNPNVGVCIQVCTYLGRYVSRGMCQCTLLQDANASAYGLLLCDS